MKKGDYFDTLLRAPQTVFTIQDVALLWGEDDARAVSVRLQKYVHAGKLLRLRRGIYAKDALYDRFELATRIYTPAYVSFESVLTREGIVFQFYRDIYVASYLNRRVVVDGQPINYVRMKDAILRDVSGIEQRDGYARATKERAFLDRLYISKQYHFDNLAGLDVQRLEMLLPLYQNKRLERQVREIVQTIQSSV